ncbi:MAG: DNA-processing protein DprA [bacterium]|nr:DNA-processing protein DprA [bacterium]
MVISSINFKQKDFPKALLEISAHPKKLFILGKIPDLPMIAIVGTRRPTEYGRQITYRLSFDLAKSGFAVVSGLALGIDSIAHRAALDAGGKTVAVLGNGLDNIYPSSNRSLAKNILANGGAIISEYESGTPPLRHHFPARNRIIAGLSLATIITEADAKSGSLITANFALQQNRLVMAVPGNVTSLKSAGPNNLIKSGAVPITDAVDVLSILGLKNPDLAPKTVKADSKEEALIIELIGQGINTTQALIEKSNISADQLASIISLMEITGKVKNLGAGQWTSQ